MVGDVVQAFDEVRFLLEGSVEGQKPLADDDQAEAEATDHLDELEQAEVRDYLYEQLLRVNLERDLQPVRVVFKVRIGRQALHQRLGRQLHHLIEIFMARFLKGEKAGVQVSQVRHLEGVSVLGV